MLQSAKRMKEITDNVREKQMNEEMNNIKNLINKAVKQGEYEFSITSLSMEAENTLADLGYIVVHRQCGINEYEYRVSWS